MSETLSQDPESLGSGYGLASNYPPTPATPSSTVQDPPGSNLPPFSTFSADMDTASGFATDRFLSDTRLLDISNWEYYPEARILERTENGLSIIASQPQYRPWESKPVDSSFAPTTPVTTFADAFAAQNGVSKLPSFQSQFQSFNEPVTTTEPTLTTLTNLTPVSPNSSSPTLTTLNTANFHTLSAVNPRNYPLVPAPIQAREIPSIQQQFLDERHIQLYTHPTANIATLNPAGSIFQPQNGAIIQSNQLLGSSTVVTVIKSEPDLKLASNIATLSSQDTGLKIQNLHPTHFQNPMSTMMDNNGLYNGLDKKLNGMNAALGSPTRNDFRKKERRKMRASSLESSAESDGASSNMDLGSESSGQVAAVSSTASFKSHHVMPGGSSVEVDEISGGNVDKQVKKKRKRCGECIGCQRKDNCGDCAPCRNDKSHQICKQRRCEKLTEKKSYRGRKPSGPVSLSNTPVPEPSVPSSRPSPQPVHMLKPEQPVQQQPMAPMPFYADPTRFSAPVWQTEPAQTWPQGQFIQQIQASAQPTLEAYPPQQYPNGIYPTTYQQPATFETGTFYTGVQVLTNARPPSAPNHAQLTPRANGSYSHTPSPVSQQTQPQPTAQRSNISGQYHQEYVDNQGYVAPTTPTGGSGLNNSRPNSVNSAVNVPTSSQNFQQQSGGNFTSVSSTNFSPSSTNTNPNFVNAGSGNEKPGYPQVNSSPRLVSHSSSGYPGNEYSGNIQSEHWPVSVNSENMMWEPPNIGQQNLEGAKNNPEHNEGPYSNKPHESNQNQCGGEDQFSQSSRVNLNSRIKTMILNKQHNVERKLDEEQQQQGESDDKTGHFLWYSHHRRPPDLIGGGGGVPSPTSDFRNLLLDRSRQPQETQHKSPPRNAKSKQDTNFISNANGALKTKRQEHNDPPNKYYRDHCARTGEKNSPQLQNYFANCFVGNDSFEAKAAESDDKIKSNTGTDIPQCSCFPPDKMAPEPGNYYTHLGCASSLVNLRNDLETRTGMNGQAIRIEKICYTGKEGKTAQGCPLAKWIIRRSNSDEKYLILVKHRQGHVCVSAYIVVCIVAWEGVSLVDADSLYKTLTDKLNSFGVTTNRRCATNEQRTCACQGLDPKTCGASFSFGCSWSMYYNGCKFARSKIVRKFRLSEKNEEENIEKRLQSLATHITPLYRILAPDSFKNQCEYEDVAGECRLGVSRGKPFSGVTACVDFCAHAHKDSHNMNNGCTVVVSLTKERSLAKPEDEQLHVLPLYTIDNTDEFGSKENQDAKVRVGSVEILNRYECEVRVRTVPLQPCRRRKKKEEDSSPKESPSKRENVSSRSSTSSGYDSSRSQTPQTPSKNIDGILQSNHISSTVLDSPKSWGYDNYPLYYNQYHYPDANNPPMYRAQDKMNTAFNFTYPKPAQNILLQNKVQDSYSGIRISNQTPNNGSEYNFNAQLRQETIPYDYHHQFKPQQATPFKIPQTPPQDHFYYSPYYPQNDNGNHWGDVWRNHSIADTSRIIQESLLPHSPSAWYHPEATPPKQHDVNLNYQLCNPFDDFGDYGLKRPDCGYFSPPTTPWFSPKSSWDVAAPQEALGKVTDVIDNAESFRDSQIGGVAIALGHGSVLFECAKHELHATTALKKPNRTCPTRISLVFYQHRNLNRSKHGWDEWEEKNKLKKMGLSDVNLKVEKIEVPDLKDLIRRNNAEILLRAPTLTTMSITTLFPMYPCMVTGPYQEAHSFG